MFNSINKTFGCCSKIFGWSNKKFVVPNFVAVTKPFFFREGNKAKNTKYVPAYFSKKITDNVDSFMVGYT